MASRYQLVVPKTSKMFGGDARICKRTACTMVALAVVLVGLAVAGGGVHRWVAPPNTAESSRADAILLAGFEDDFDRFSKSNYKCAWGKCVHQGSDKWISLTMGVAGHWMNDADDCMRWILEKRDPNITGGECLDFGGLVGSLAGGVVHTGCKCFPLYHNKCNIYVDNSDWMHISHVSRSKTCSVTFSGVDQGWELKTCVQHHSQTLSFTSGLTKTKSVTKTLEISSKLVGGVGLSLAASHAHSEQTQQTVPINVTLHQQKCLWLWRYSMQHFGQEMATITTNSYVLTPSPDKPPQCYPNRFDLKDTSFQTCVSPQSKLPGK